MVGSVSNSSTADDDAFPVISNCITAIRIGHR
jgi:hypothetical protein